MLYAATFDITQYFHIPVITQEWARILQYNWTTIHKRVKTPELHVARTFGTFLFALLHQGMAQLYNRSVNKGKVFIYNALKA